MWVIISLIMLVVLVVAGVLIALGKIVSMINEDRRKKYKYQKAVARNFGTYKGILIIQFNSVDDYVIKSGCYSTDNIVKWWIKAETRIGKEEATKHTILILQELMVLQERI